ncbi:MAG: 16S rRNA (guanine(966)-N(2))-methyltransferase RsmD [Clostridia bacterium]|jgi:16S rRNA (guanine(966)-N(2))-methyltransferase RsmD|nr:16S rRNA (guanine(966)-N(2))-methyltransferase RsmD [Clostridia bacterium]
MRVISGSARGHKLKTLETLDTRPTLDRMKETVFNIIGMDIYDIKFLDLFSGFGGMGIEALSRGAEISTFVELNRECVEVINENLRHTKLIDKADVKGLDVFGFIKSTDEKYDIIYIDPPYNAGFENELLKGIFENDILEESGYIILEHLTDVKITSNSLYTVYREKKYKTTTLSFIRRGE